MLFMKHFFGLNIFIANIKQGIFVLHKLYPSFLDIPLKYRKVTDWVVKAQTGDLRLQT